MFSLEIIIGFGGEWVIWYAPDNVNYLMPSQQRIPYKKKMFSKFDKKKISLDTMDGEVV